MATLNIENIRAARIAGVTQFSYNSQLFLPALTNVQIEGKDFTSNEVLFAIGSRLKSFDPALEVVMEANADPSKNGHYYYMADDNCTDFTMIFDETEKALVSSYFMAWRALQINPDGTYNSRKYYEQTIELQFLTKDGRVAFSILYEGVKINNIRVSGADYGSSEPVTTTITCSYNGPLLITT